MTPADLGHAFLNHEPIPGVRFEHNDLVMIVNGQHTGRRGSLVTVLNLTPEPSFLVELESGFDVEILQSALTSVAPSSP